MGISHSTPAYEKQSNLTMSKSNSRDHFVPSFISLSPDHYGARQRKRMDQLIWVLCLYAASKGLCISWIRILPNRFLKTSMSTPRLYSLPARNQALQHFPCSFRGLVGCWFYGSSTLNGGVSWPHKLENKSRSPTSSISGALTNNEAEYEALTFGLLTALEMCIKVIKIRIRGRMEFGLSSKLQENMPWWK